MHGGLENLLLLLIFFLLSILSRQFKRIRRLFDGFTFLHVAIVYATNYQRKYMRISYKYVYECII